MIPDIVMMNADNGLSTYDDDKLLQSALSWHNASLNEELWNAVGNDL